MTDATLRQIARINELSQLARASWIGLLAYLAFVFVTLLGVEDADFFVPSRQTQLPLVNVAIPTASFFVFAPVLAAALYVYLHLFLLKLWDAFAEAPAQVRTHPERPEWAPLGDLVHPWLANDIALALKGDGAGRNRPLQGMSSAVTRLLVWIAGPFVLGMFWWRSMPAHNEWLTLLIAACFLVATTAGIASWGHARARIPADPKRRRPPPKWRRDEILIGTLLIAISLLRTEHNGIAGLATLARTDLANVELVPLPVDWRSPETARKAFRVTWCAREALAMTVCDHLPEADRPPPPHVAGARAVYCREHAIGADAGPETAVRACTDHFAALDERFKEGWFEERRSNRSNLPALDLSGRDLRSALANGVVLVGADLTKARMERADLASAQMEGAIANEAQMQEANFNFARLEGARLYRARLEAANLAFARMEQTLLWEARLEGAYLFSAQLEGANLRDAWMEGAILTSAQMERANLTGARMKEADLNEAWMEGADLRGADLRLANWLDTHLRSPAHFADLRGAQDLTQEQLDTVIGDEFTLLPDNPPLHVWNCWIEPPANIESLLIRAEISEQVDSTDIRARWLCNSDNPRRKTGTPLALDAPRPPGHPLDTRD